MKLGKKVSVSSAEKGDGAFQEVMAAAPGVRGRERGGDGQGWSGKVENGRERGGFEKGEAQRRALGS